MNEYTDHKGRTIRRPDEMYCPLCGSKNPRGLWAMEDVANIHCEDCGEVVNVDLGVSNTFGFVDE